MRQVVHSVDGRRHAAVLTSGIQTSKLAFPSPPTPHPSHFPRGESATLATLVREPAPVLAGRRDQPHPPLGLSITHMSGRDFG